MWSDIRYSIRRLVQDKSFTILALVALGLGIGATTAIYSLIHGVILNPFPYVGSDRLMAIAVTEVGRNGGRTNYTGAETLELQENTKDIFDGIVATNQKQVVVTSSGAVPIRLLSAEVSSNTFPFFGMPAFKGRVITAADTQPDAPPVIVLNYKTWLHDFGADPGVIGRVVRLDEKSYEIVGVMPPRFAWQGAALWTPLAIERSIRTDTMFFLLGRLKPGVSQKVAETALVSRFEALAKTHPKLYPAKWRISLDALVDLVVGDLRKMLMLLSAAVGMLLLIACGNVATLLLARATAREKEISVRMALGASRSRLIRQMMTESMLLSVGGALLGIGLAFVAIDGLVALAPAQAIPAEAVVSLNIPVLLFTIAASVLTAFLFGLAPALHASRKDVQNGLRDTGKGVGGGGFRHKGLRGALVVAEVALSLVLLIGSGLLMRSFMALGHVKLGFNPENMIAMPLPISAKRYDTKEKKAAYLRLITDKIATLPGIQSVSVHTGLPPYGGGGMPVDILGKPDDATRTPLVQLSDDRVLETLSAPLLLGRNLSADDIRAARPVAVVNESFAKSYGVAIGSRLKLKPIAELPPFEIVGVFADVKNNGLEGVTQPEFFVPHTITVLGDRGILIRTTTSAASMIKPVQQAVWAVDPEQPVTEIKTVRQWMQEFSFTMPEFGLTLIGTFAFAGLTLMSIGVYSLLSYAVSRSKHEIGIRMALGAQVGDILRKTLESGMRLVALGGVIGLALGFGAAQALKSFLFGVQTADPATAIGACLLLGVVGVAACLVPARRASKVDPLEALRCS